MSIHKRTLANGETAWRVHWRDPNGRQRTKQFRRKTDAERHQRTQRQTIDQGQWTDPNQGKRPLRTWWETLKTSKHNRPSTTQRDNSIWTTHIEPRWGDTPTSAINLEDLLKWFAAIDRSPSTKIKIRSLLKQTLDIAVKAGAINTNPVADLPRPQLKQTEQPFLTIGQVKALADHIAQTRPDLALLVSTAAMTGMRQGELFALRARHIDTTKNVITVARSVTTVGSQIIEGEPKSNRHRTIKIPDSLTAQLAAHCAATPPDGLVWPSRTGTWIRSRSFMRTCWTPAVKACGLPPVRFHDLRHTHAAILIAQGAHPKAIQRRFGHSSITVTMDTYGHLFDELDAQIADGLETTMFGTG